jgi:hypothetical protein
VTWRKLVGDCRQGTRDTVAVVRGSDERTSASLPSRSCITAGGNDPGAEDRWGLQFLGQVRQRPRHLAVSGLPDGTEGDLHQLSLRQ